MWGKLSLLALCLATANLATASSKQGNDGHVDRRLANATAPTYLTGLNVKKLYLYQNQKKPDAPKGVYKFKATLGLGTNTTNFLEGIRLVGITVGVDAGDADPFANGITSTAFTYGQCKVNTQKLTANCIAPRTQKLLIKIKNNVATIVGTYFKNPTYGANLNTYALPLQLGIGISLGATTPVVYVGKAASCRRKSVGTNSYKITCP